MSDSGKSGSRILMRMLAGGLLGFGLVSGYFALNMDTTVMTPGGQVYGVEVPSYPVNNLGLMDERRTQLLVAGFAIVIGLGFFVASSYRPSPDSEPPVGAPGPLRTCPYCAEDIRTEAVVCRYCGRDIPPASSAESLHSAGEYAVATPEELRLAVGESDDCFRAWRAALDDGGPFSAEEDVEPAHQAWIDSLQRIRLLTEGTSPETRAEAASMLETELSQARSDEALASLVVELRSA